jgi:TRAP-type transport system periplasmic protein
MNPAQPPQVWYRTLKTTLAAVAAGAMNILGVALAQEPIVIKVAHVAPHVSSFQTAAVQMNAALEKISNKTMRLEIVPGGALGNIPQLWAQVRAGALDVHLADMAAITAMKEARSFNIVNMPFLFRNETHFDKFVGSSVFNTMMSEFEQGTTIKFAGFLGPRPPRALSTSKTAVRSIADMKGLKVRTPEIGPITEAFKAFGASPTPIKAADLYTALQTGLVDGQDNGIIDTVAAGYTEVQKFYSPIDYLHSGLGIWISQKRWSSLTPQQQGWFIQAVQETAKHGRAAYAKQYEDALAQAKTKGMQIVTVDKSGFEKVGTQLIDSKDGTDWPKGLAQQIRDLK